MMALAQLEERNGGFSLTWKVSNYSFAERNWYCLYSPKVVVEMLDNTEWQLKLLPRRSYDRKIALTLSRVTMQEDSGPISICTDVKLFILRKDGKFIFREIKGVHFSKNYSSLPLNVSREKVFGDSELLPEDTFTAGCHIINCYVKYSFWLEYIACTRIDMKRNDYRFPIQIPVEMGHHISIVALMYSPSTEFPGFEIILISPCLCGNAEEIKVNIRMRECRVNFFTICKISLEDLEGNQKYLFRGEHWYISDSSNQNWFLEKPIKISELSLNCATDNILIMSCKLTVSDTTHTSFISSVNYSSCSMEAVSHLKNSANESARAMYMDKKFCDFTIWVHGEAFPIHKAVLGAVSPVFQDMFDTNMSNEKYSMMIIGDTDTDTVRKMLEFVYTDTCVNLMCDSALKLCYVADRYKILHLKEYCSKFLQLNLNCKHILKVLRFTNLRQDRFVIKTLNDFIRANSKTIFCSDEWVDIMKYHAEFACGIMHEIILNSNLVKTDI